MKRFDRARASLAPLLAAAALLAACTQARPAMTPRPLSLEPAVAYGTVPTPVVIHGDGFYARGVQLASGGSYVDTHHRAWLGALELTDVTWVDGGTLRAMVPAGLSPGTYDVTVENAFGDRGAAGGAYRVISGTPAILRATLAAPSVANVGDSVSATLTVANDGGATALAVAPMLSIGGTGALVATAPPPAPADVPAGGAVAFTWSLQAAALGDASLSVQGGGTDPATGIGVALPPTSATEHLVRPAALGVAIVAAPALVDVGQPFDVTVRVANAGDSDAASTTLTIAIPGATPPSVLVALGTVAGGTSQDVTRSFAGAVTGTGTIAASVAGTDGTDGNALSASSAAALQVQGPAVLAATLSLPNPLSIGDATATLTVVNTGEATALGVAPGTALGVGSGTAVVSYVSGPSPAGAAVDLAAGQQATFTWVYHVASAGTVQLTANVAGTDATSGAPLGASSTFDGGVTEAIQLAADPFGDGTAFSFATTYHGQLWLGPSADGTTAVSMNLDGSVRQPIALAFPKDTTAAGTKSANTWAPAPPFPSIGALGCATNTAACGPDNENGRGLFTSVTLAGSEWLVAVGAKPGGNLNYLYMTPDTGSPLAFRYVDLSQQLSAETRTASAVAALAGRLYVGLPGKGGNSPFLLVLAAPPSAPGSDPVTGPTATSLEMSKMPYVGASGSPKNSASVLLVDALAAFSNRLYTANDGGIVRSTTSQPRPYGTAPSDWATCTPASVVKSAVTTTKQSDLEPADKAFPQLVSFGAGLFAARNVYLSGATGAVGGQLWRCVPTALDAFDSQPQCAPSDWSLVVPDGGADGRAAATVLVASTRYLYLGFNRPGGARIFRTSSPAPATLSDFTGQGGCIAGSTGCQGLGGDGFGDSRNTRFFDARAFTDASGNTGLVVTTGDPSATPAVPVRVYRILE